SATSSPSSPMTAMRLPTSISSPAPARIFRSTPLASASTSCVTLSVSSSYSGSPFSTLSPSDLSQRTIVPASMPWPSRGRLTSVAIAATHRAHDRVEDIRLVRHDELLHHRRERQRHEARADALDRGVEPVEGVLLDDRRHLGAEAHPRDRLVRD